MAGRTFLAEETAQRCGSGDVLGVTAIIDGRGEICAKSDCDGP